jgi:hypothetical protein
MHLTTEQRQRKRIDISWFGGNRRKGKGGAGVAIKNFVSRHTLACLAGGFAIGVVISGAGAAMMSFSGSPAFCGTCHSMKEVTETFAQSTHSKLECVDCHLPHDSMVMYLFEKGRTGMNDVYHEVLRDYPAHIKLSARGRDMVNRNCLRCHANTMNKVHADLFKPMDTGGDCLKCHSRIAHGARPIEGGIKVE